MSLHFHVHGTSNLDQSFFAVAKRQLDLCEEAQRSGDASLVPGFLAACLAMTCAAMESHANYLGRSSVRGDFPNHLKLSAAAWERLERGLDLATKWTLLGPLLTGSHVLDPGSEPLRSFYRSVQLRNRFAAHPKPTVVSLSLTGWGEFVGFLSDLFSERAHSMKEHDIPRPERGRSAMRAAQETAKALYAAMEKAAPDWALAGGD